MSAPQGYTSATLAEFAGHDFGASAPIPVDQDRINGFADVTGDHQWIHVDVDRARAQSPFGGPVAHGFLTLSLLAAAIQDRASSRATPRASSITAWIMCAFWRPCRPGPMSPAPSG